MLEIEKIYRRRWQRWSPYEESVLRLAVEARYTDEAIGRIMGRTHNTIRRHRRLLHLAKPRGRSAAAVIVGCLIGFSAAAHDGADPLSTWYQSLKDPETGISCCSMQRDCQTVDDYHASATPGGYVVRLGERWLEVPPNKVLQRTDNPTGHAVVCLQYIDGTPVARCFIRAIES